MDYDVLVVGSGIGGMESAIKLGDMGYRVLVVEKEASVGGKMILLSKVFPTLDCASCISTPKMASTIHHPNITAMTYSEVKGIEPGPDGHFHATVRRKARYVDEVACTGCQLCEVACTVAVPDQFNADLVARRAAYIPFPQAVPKKAVIERTGSSPCSFACPAGIQAHGYVSLIRCGEYEKAFQLVLETTPLVGTLGRACYAPCEVACTRGDLEGTLPIRRLKRFVDDWHHEHPGTAPGRGRAAQRHEGGHRGLRSSRPDRRLAAGAQGLRRPDPGGGARARWLPAPRHPCVPSAGGGRGARHPARPRHRRGHRHEPCGLRPRRAACRGLRRHPARDRDAPIDAPGDPRRGSCWRHRRCRVPALGATRRADRPCGQAGRGGRRRQRRDRRREDRASSGRPIGAHRLPPRPRRDARPPTRRWRTPSTRASRSTS